jgi:hypothetical protein
MYMYYCSSWSSDFHALCSDGKEWNRVEAPGI